MVGLGACGYFAIIAVAGLEAAQAGDPYSEYWTTRQELTCVAGLILLLASVLPSVLLLKAGIRFHVVVKLHLGFSALAVIPLALSWWLWRH